ncbi:MAG TPA: hypothetical protein VF324_02860 [Methanobacterium sp.]
MVKSTKILLILFIVLIAVLGITAGVLLQTNNGKVTANNSTTNNSSPVNQSTEPVTPQATWHQVANYTEPTAGLMNFNIQGQKCKVVMSATPQLNNGINILTVDLLKNSSALTTGTIAWEPTEAVTKKEKTLEVSAGPGNYQVNIYVTNLQSWNVTVWDYY